MAHVDDRINDTMDVELADSHQNESLEKSIMSQHLPGVLDNITVVRCEDNNTVSSVETHSSTEDSIFRIHERIAKNNNDQNSQHSEFSSIIQRMSRAINDDSSPLDQNLLVWLENELQQIQGVLDNISIVSDDDNNNSVSSVETHSSTEDTQGSIFRIHEQFAEDSNDESSQRSKYSDIIQRLIRVKNNYSSHHNQNSLVWLENELQQIQLEITSGGTTDEESEVTEDPESGEKELSAFLDNSVVADLQKEIFVEEHPFVTAVSSPTSKAKEVIKASHDSIDSENQKRFDLAVQSLFSERLHLKRLHVNDENSYTTQSTHTTELTGRSQHVDKKTPIEDVKKKRCMARLTNLAVVAAAASAVVPLILGDVTVPLPFFRLPGRQNDLKFRIKELERHLKESNKNLYVAESEAAKIRKTLYNSERKVTQLEETLAQATHCCTSLLAGAL